MQIAHKYIYSTPVVQISGTVVLAWCGHAIIYGVAMPFYTNYSVAYTKVMLFSKIIFATMINAMLDQNAL